MTTWIGKEGDIMQVQYEGYGCALRNAVRIEDRSANVLFQVRLLD